jgi:hypothetical protein
MPFTPAGRWITAAAVASAIVTTGASLAAETIDRVLAVAAGELIMLSDVVAARDFGLVVPDPTAPDPVRAVLARLIDRELVLAEVERYAPAEPPAEAVDRELQIVRGRFATRRDYDTALARSGIDENQLRETLRQNLRIKAYEDQRFTVPPPGDDELHAYFSGHIRAFARDGQAPRFEEVRADVARAVIAEKHAALVEEWIAGLRRRADVIDLYLLPVR